MSVFSGRLHGAAPQRRLQEILRCLAAVLFVILLSSCARLDMAVVVASDMSGTVRIRVGVENRVLSLAQAQGPTILDELVNSARQSDWDSVEQWSEGDYQWVEVTRNTANLDELESTLSSLNAIATVEITNERGVLTLDLTTDPSATAGETEYSALADGVVVSRFLVEAPGEVITTNGIRDRDTGGYMWLISWAEPTNVHIETKLPFQWPNPYILGAIVLITVVGLFIENRSRAIRSRHSDDVDTPDTPSDDN